MRERERQCDVGEVGACGVCATGWLARSSPAAGGLECGGCAKCKAGGLLHLLVCTPIACVFVECSNK